MVVLSRYLFLMAFAGYLISTILYIASFTAARWRRPAAALAGGGTVPLTAPARSGLGSSATQLLALAAGAQGLAIALRWAGSGQAPLSNMFEYMAFFGWSIMLAFLLINRFYRVPMLGAFVAPLGVIIIGYASLFPQEVQPLVPALQSYWLVLHVAFAALGEGAFAVSFVAATLYLLRVRNEGSSPMGERILELLLFSGMALAGFITGALAAKLTGYRLTIPGTNVVYSLPPLVGPQEVASGSLGSWMGLPLPLLITPEWMEGTDAGRKLNTLVISLILGLILYGLVRLLTGRSLRALGSTAASGMSPEMLDEISYRGIAVGFPVFTLGGMVFAMIWAQKAWGSYWSWDPKETWSLISWLFYAGYLHLRVARGWEGRPAAWTAAVGFAVVLFTLVGVNLLISGLHSYAGG